MAFPRAGKQTISCWCFPHYFVNIIYDSKIGFVKCMFEMAGMFENSFWKGSKIGYLILNKF